jgi:hypothetical protein
MNFQFNKVMKLDPLVLYKCDVQRNWSNTSTDQKQCVSLSMTYTTQK